MAIKIIDYLIDRLCIIDDDEGSRLSYVEEFYDSKFNAFPQNEKVEDVDYFLDKILKTSDAVISDHQLKKRKNYFPINGAQVVYKCYERNKPCLLVTRYDQTQMSEIRKYRKNIPVILNPAQFAEDTVYQSLEVCIMEFKGQIRADRKLWRTLIRIDAVDDHHIYIIIPGWDTSEIISIGREELPDHIQTAVEVDKRLHVQINIGCESANDLYFDNWEIK